MKTPYKYTVERYDSPYTFMVYKWPILGNPEKPESGYQVDLYKYSPENHGCTCEHGMHVKFEGKKIVDCKHVKLVLEALNAAWNKAHDEGLICDSAITLKDLCEQERQLVLSQIK